jgi:uncharacterized membrane protein
VANLVIGSATGQIANGSKALAVLDTGISVPGVSSSGLNLAVVQAPSSWYGTPLNPSPTLTTSQLSSQTSTKSGLQLQVSNLPVTIAGIPGATISGTVNVSLTGAGAQAHTMNPVCGTSFDIVAQPQPFHTSVTGSGLTLTIPLGSPLSVGVTAAQDVTSNPATKTFNFPTDFSDLGNPGANKPWHVGSTTLQFSQLNYGITVNGTIPLGTTLPLIQQAVSSAVNSTVAQFDPKLDALFRELGLAVGGADVWATQMKYLDPNGNPAPCSSPTTTTTAPPPTTTTTTTTPAQNAPVLVK